MENQKIILSENNKQAVLKPEKKKTAIKILIIIFVMLPIVISVVYMFTDNMFPSKKQAMKHAEQIIEGSVTIINANTNENIGSTLEDIEFTSVKYEKFKDKGKKYGFYEYCLNTPIIHDGKECNYVDFYKEEYNIDIFDVKKYAYTLKGNCTLKDRDGNISEKDFEIVLIQVTGTYNWMCINDDMFSGFKSLKDLAESDVKVYTTVMYQDVKNCRVEVTDKVEEENVRRVTVYGKVYITDRYGDEYESRFKAVYDYNYNEFIYEKEEIELSTPTRV